MLAMLLQRVLAPGSKLACARTLKGRELEIGPIHHRLEQRVRAHVFLCMLAYHLEWHLREAWAPLTFQDESPPLAADPVARAERSQAAKRKASRKRTAAGGPCHSFRSLLSELLLVVPNRVHVPGTGVTFTKVTEPDAVQARALQLAGARLSSPARTPFVARS